jgi:hypothetical protein
MPQSPNQVYPAVSGGVARPLNNDANGLLLSTVGGDSTQLNITAAAVVKNSAGRIAKIVILAPGSTGGAFTLNNCATTGAATTANQVFTLPYDSTLNLAGSVIELDMLCSAGIVVSAVPTGGSPRIAITYS